MKIILAESGKGILLDNDRCPTLSSLKDLLSTMTHIPIAQQILLSTFGTQIKDTNYTPTSSTDTFVLFNRQHLERNTESTLDDSNKNSNDIHDSQQYPQQEPWLKILIDKQIPSMVDINQLHQHYNTLTSLVDTYKQKQQHQQQEWSRLDYVKFYQQWTKTVQRSVQEIANLSSHNGLLADTMTQELKMQMVALKAALSNLDNHIKSTYHSQTKFERIAKKELAKHAQAMALVDMDLSFMHEIKLHSQIQSPANSSVELQLYSLIDCFSITPMASLKAQLQKDYDRLLKKTNNLTNKMNSIYEQSTHINIQHTGSDVVIDKVNHTLGDIQSYLSSINDLWYHLEQRWKERDLENQDPSLDDDDDDDEKMKHIIDCQEDSDTLATSENIGTTEQQNDSPTDINNKSGTNDSGSREYKGDSSDTDTEMDDDTNNPMESTIKKTDIKNVSDENLAKRLFLYESLIRTSLETIIEEKRNALVNFFKCLQTISFLEESIANLFLSLRRLGNDIKQLVQKTDQLETVSKGIIEGYGLMLIELWRRNQYHQIITKNADLLTGLFSAFASSEQRYRDKFQTDICMIDGLESLLLGTTKIKDNLCIIPFIYKEFTNDETSCTTIPTLDIALAPNHQCPSPSYPSDINNNIIPLETSPPLICKKDVEDFIDLMQSYYTSFQGFQGQSKDKAMVNIMVERLSERLDRESRRLTHGLIKLGLPTNKMKKDPVTIYSSSSSSPSSASSLPSNTSTISTTSMPTTVSTNMQVQPSYNLPFVPSLSKKEWASSSIYAQVQLQQDMKVKIETLEQKLKHDHEVFEKQRSVLLEEIKMKDNQFAEKQKQWESQWSTKVEDIEQQLDMEQRAHENDIIEWKTRYQEALDTEQKKHNRRLAYFHERLNAKNIEYAELEQQLTQSEPTSPVQQHHGKLIVQEKMAASLDRSMMMTMLEENNANEAIMTSTQPLHRWRRSASLDATSINPDLYSLHRSATITQPEDLQLETNLHSPLKSKQGNNTEGTAAAAAAAATNSNTSTSLSFKDELYARELQDMTLRHQASIDNMISEYEENRMELLAQHSREKEVWKIEHDAELQEACTKLAQEHGSILDDVNQSWQKKWDDLVDQSKRDQLLQKQQWDRQLEAAKLEWETRHSKEQADLKKQLSWSKGELHMMLKEHETAIRLAKQLNLAIDHTIDVDDMKYTLLGLLETGIQHASRLDTQDYLVEKSSESTPFGFMNLSFF